MFHFKKLLVGGLAFCLAADPVLPQIQGYSIFHKPNQAVRVACEALSPSLISAAFSAKSQAQTPHRQVMHEGAQAFRGAILHFLRSPKDSNDIASYQYFEDGLLLIKNGKVKTVGPADQLLPSLGSDVPVQHYPDSLIMPGFIDAHVHYPQTEMIASYGEQLLEWLNKYTFPTEAKFADKAHAKRVAKTFLQELLRNGTTSALVFSTVHRASVEALFEEAEARNMRLITGKVLMDRNAPEYLLDTPVSAYEDSKRLILKWHKKPGTRLRYAVTPRFAPTSTEEELQSAERLMREFPDIHMHTHLSENRNEVEWVRALFPWSTHYLDVYDHFHLLGPRSLFAHSIHLVEEEWKRLAQTRSAIAFCSSSNLFLGSGLFNLVKSKWHRIQVGIGSDIGAGTSFSILRNLNEAYKIMQLQGEKLSPLEAFYLATLGGAKALSLDDTIGNFSPGKEANFIILNLKATPLQAIRMQTTTTLFEKLFALMMLGDDRNVRATYIMGQKAYAAQRESKWSKWSALKYFVKKYDGVFWAAATVFVMMAFSANSILCRLAMKPVLLALRIDPASFSMIRIFSGTVMLWVVSIIPVLLGKRSKGMGGSWLSGFLLFTYMAPFSFGYVSLKAATGTLIMFTAVHAFILIYGHYFIKDKSKKLHTKEVIGLLVAAFGLTSLEWFGLEAPTLAAFLLLTVSGMSWGFYTVRGFGSETPFYDTRGNFTRGSIFSLLLLPYLLMHPSEFHLSFTGVKYAALSGSVFSALFYLLWYKDLRSWKWFVNKRSAMVQLIVPSLAAIGGWLFLSEKITLHTGESIGATLLGLAIAFLPRMQFRNTSA